MRRLLPLIVIGALSAPLSAELSLIEFTGTLLGKTPDGSVTILAVQVTPTTSIDVRVTDLTEIRDGLDEKTVDDLVGGMVLKIEAFHTSEGFTAREIEITDGAALIEVRGQVTAKTGDPDSLTVASLTFQVNESTSIKDFSTPPNQLAFDDISVGDFVKIEAFPADGQLVAATVKVGDPEDRFARLAFEGIVESLDGDLVWVAVEAIADPIPVLLTEDTRIQGGELAPGVRVTVIGHLNTGLMVVADKIIVKQLFKLTPVRAKVHLNDCRQMQVVLTEVLEADLVLSIESADPALVSVDPAEVTVGAGELSAFFEICSGELTGTTSVSATAGELTAVASVEVMDNGGGPPFNIAWRPPVLNGKAGQSRVVKLQLSKPAEVETIVTIVQSEGAAGLLAAFPAEVIFAPGEKQQDVAVELGADPGEGALVAEMPSGDQARLRIKVR